MNTQLNNLLLLAEDNIFQDKTNPQINSLFNESGKNSFRMANLPGGMGVGNIIGSLIKFGDICMILLLLVGMLYFIFSNIGNSGETRKKGADAIYWTYIFLMFIHLLVVCMYSPTMLSSGKITAFMIMFVGQIITMPGSIILYAFASVYLQIYTMTGQEGYKRQARTCYSSMIWTMVGSCAAVLVVELL